MAIRNDKKLSAGVVKKTKPVLRESNDLGRQGKKRGAVTGTEIDYSDEEREFLVAMERYKRERSASPSRRGAKPCRFSSRWATRKGA